VPSSAVPAVEGRAATTIRLRPAAAAALNSAWLYQRMQVAYAGSLKPRQM
jgi:hypothetical protein